MVLENDQLSAEYRLAVLRKLAAGLQESIAYYHLPWWKRVIEYRRKYKSREHKRKVANTILSYRFSPQGSMTHDQVKDNEISGKIL